MAQLTKETLEADDLKVLADRGYFSGEEIMKCQQAGVTPLVPKPLTNNSATTGASINATSAMTPSRSLSLPGRAKHHGFTLSGPFWFA